MPKGVYPRHVKRHAVTQPSDPSYRLIALTQNKNAIVDAKDFLYLSQWNWFAFRCQSTGDFYARRTVPLPGNKWKTVYMHQELLGGMCDHKNHDTLDNRRDNLRRCTRAQNGWNRGKSKNNTSGYKGVVLHRSNGKWVARIGFKYLGIFPTKKLAADAYDAAAKIYHGDFAVTNLSKEKSRNASN